MRRLSTTMALAPLVCAPCVSAQPSQDALNQLFTSFDLVCSSLTSCHWKPKTSVVAAAAAAVATPPAGDTPASPNAAGTPASPMASTATGNKAAPASTTTKTTEDSQTKKSFAEALTALGQVDLSVPDSPAFAVLGISPSQVQRPGTVRELAASLLRGVDEKGKAKTGAAFDFAPLPLFAPQLIVGGKPYADNNLLQALTRTTFSLATTEATDGKGTQLAWGVRMGVFDFGDPGRHYRFMMDCVKKVNPTVVPPGPTIDGLSAEEEEAFSQRAAECDPAKGLDLWAKPALYVGFGQSKYSASGRLTGTVPAAKAWWATYSQGWSRGPDSVRTLFQLHASTKRDDRVEDPDDASKLIRQDSRQLIGRVRAGKDTWHAFADVGRKHTRLGNNTKEKLRHAGLGAEFKVLEGTWLQLGTVRESGFADGKSQNTVSTGLRFGSEPLFTTPGK